MRLSAVISAQDNVGKNGSSQPMAFGWEHRDETKSWWSWMGFVGIFFYICFLRLIGSYHIEKDRMASIGAQYLTSTSTPADRRGYRRCCSSASGEPVALGPPATRHRWRCAVAAHRQCSQNTDKHTAPVDSPVRAARWTAYNRRRSRA